MTEPEEWGPPTVNGGSAGLNSAMFFTCPDCGACVIDMHYVTTNRVLHQRWHAGRLP